MSVQTICDACGEVIDTAQPYYQASVQQIQNNPDGTPVVVEPATQRDYHADHLPGAEGPTLTSLEPSEKADGSGDTQVHLHGTGFDDQSVIVFNGSTDLPTAFVSATELTTTIGEPGQGEHQLAVRVGDTTTDSLLFTIT